MTVELRGKQASKVLLREGTGELRGKVLDDYG